MRPGNNALIGGGMPGLKQGSDDNALIGDEMPHRKVPGPEQRPGDNALIGGGKPRPETGTYIL